MTFSGRGRIKFLVFLFLTFSGVLFWRLFTWQVVRADELSDIAKSQHSASKTIQAKRGSILASDNFPLVSSKEAWVFWVSPKKIKEIEKFAKVTAPLVTEDPLSQEATESAKNREQRVYEEEERIKSLLITKKDSAWVPIKRKVGRLAKEQIEKLGIEGVGFDSEEDRNYPEGSMAAHLVGFVGKDAAGEDKGYFGLEGYYDLSLSGASGRKAWEKDAFGKPILLGIAREINALDGASLRTHIDRSIQFIIERRLEEALQKYGAKGGLVIVMRPSDGAVLAMASLPAYDPARFNLFKEDQFVNPAVGETFEPGSIFKILVMAAALDSGAVKPDDKCDQCAGPRKIGEFTIKTWNDKYYPDTTPTDIIKHSDNIGMIWTAEKLGKDKLYEYLTKFGIGQTTGIDLQGEANPGLRGKDDWGLIDLATTSFGQGIAVTAIQMIRATAVIANGGKLPVPQVVDKIVGDSWEQDIKLRFEGQNIISKKTAEETTAMMVNAVDQGEAKWAKPKGFRIAGKTGTAQIPVAGHYDTEKTIASFVGFAPAYAEASAGKPAYAERLGAGKPADSPQFVMLVSLREPKSSPWGSETAAPLWFSIARDLFPYLGIKPED